MEPSPPQAGVLRFDAFEVDRESGELRKQGDPIPLQDKPFRLLVLLLERGGQVVSRDEIRERLWGPGTFVEFDDSLNHAVKKLREALGDSAENARFIQTLPRRGYRFLAPVRAESGPQGRVPAKPLALILALGVIVAVFGWLATTYASKNSGGARIPLTRIAVLPFISLNSTPENERFADGITSDVMNGLAGAHRLRLVARSSAFQYKGRNVDVREIARSLNVEAVVEGTVRRSGDRFRITAQLADAASGFQRWSRTYELSLMEVQSIHAEIVRDISRALKVPPPGDSETLWSRTTKPEAYELVLKARYLGPTTPDAAAAKIGYYRAAIEHDSRYVSAWLGIADTWARLAGSAAVPPRDVMERAREAVDQALRLDDSSADAHFLAACIHWSYEWNWPAADREFRRAIQLDPSSATIRSFYAQFLSQMGRFDEALREVESIRVLEPLAADSRTMEASVYYLSRQYDRCLQLCQTTLAAHPAAWGLYYWLGRSYASKGMLKESLDALERFHPGKDLGGRGFGMLGAAYALSGHRTAALDLLGRVMARARHSYVSPVSVSQIHIGLGDVNAALEWLEKGYRERDLTMPTLKTEPSFDLIRADPRFVSLLRSLNLE